MVMSRPQKRTAWRELAKRRTSPNLGPDRHRGQPADPIAAHERLAARLGPSDAGQLAVQQIELDLEVVDQPQGQLDRLTSHRRELGPGQPGPPVSGEQLGTLRQPVVEQDRVDALIPAGPLADQGTAQPDLGARVGDVSWWHPGLGQGACAQQLPQVVGVVRSVLARRLGPRSARVSAGSARCAALPARSSSSATNRQPVVASRAKFACWPANRASQARSSRRVAGLSCPRRVSPLPVSR
jgi:hypothetical protein